MYQYCWHIYSTTGRILRYKRRGWPIYSNFENLTDEKKQAIIDVCMEEFARNGYEKASTNAIVKKAGISKGILFHYFGSKKNLYLYIVTYAIEFLHEKIKSASDYTAPDIFERLTNVGLKKLEISYEYPHMRNVVMDAFNDTPEAVKEDIAKLYSRLYEQNKEILFNNIDTSRFRKDIDVSKGIGLLSISLEALNEVYSKRFKGRSKEALEQMDVILEETKEYLEILKYGIYERE